MLVRELPSLWHDIEIETPGGRRYRWAPDEPHPGNVQSDLRHSSTMPGGFESLSCTLARDPARDHPDLARFSTITVRDATGEIVGEYRLNGSPRTSGDQIAISPNAVGWQAHLDDDKSASMIYVDRDLGRWGPMSRTRRVANLSAGANPAGDATPTPDAASGRPALGMEIDGNWDASSFPIIEALYDAGPGNLVYAVYYDWQHQNLSNTNWIWQAILSENDEQSTSVATGDLQGTSPSANYYGTPGTSRRYAWLQLLWNSSSSNNQPGVKFAVYWRNVAVYGASDLDVRKDNGDPGGFYASDVVGHAINRWAPLLNTTFAGQSTIATSSFVIPHLVFYDPTTAGEIVKQATRMELLDWAVWERKTFWLHARGARGRSWRARVGPARLEETGPQAERVWESIIVSYRDVDGSTRTVGPPGSGADTETAALHDPDPENPANQLGIIRRDLLQMGTATASIATQVGQRFLEQTKLLDRSGRATLVGHVTDDRGVIHPYTHVRAGDTITFVDADDPSPRRIVKAEHSHADRSCTIDIDAPPEGLQALLERLGAALVPLGL